MKPLHILHSEAATGWGGQEIRIVQETWLLLEKGHRVSIICQPGSPLTEQCEQLSHPRFRYYPVRMARTLHLAAFRAIYKIIRNHSPDILHTHSSIDSWLVSFCGKLLGKPIVRSRHVSIPVKNFFPRNLVYSYFPDRIITSGTAISDMMNRVSGVSPKQVVSIVAGVDMKRFDHRISGAPVRRKLGLKPGQPLIGKIAVLRDWKGHEYLLEAVPLVLKKFPDARFLIVGSGPMEDFFRRNVRGQGLQNSVVMTGHREDVPEILAALDVFVLASYTGEATSQVIPQAFAMKTPVVGTRAGGIPEILGRSERGILVDIRSGKSLADGIIRILEHPEEALKLTENAFQFCQRELTVEQMIDKTLAVYEDVLSVSGGAS